MRSGARWVAAGLLVGTSWSAVAADEHPFTLGIGTRLGLTTGIGLEANFGISRWVDLRAGYDFGSLNFDYDDDNDSGTGTIKYEAELSYSSLAGFVDLKPFAGGFRITGGFYSKPLQLRLKAAGPDDYDIGDRTYTGNLALNGGFDLGGVAPYLGIGWGGTSNASGFGASFDIGVQFTDSAQARLNVDGTACDATNGSCDPSGPEGFDVNGSDPRATFFQIELQKEVAELNDDAKDFDLVPVITFGLHYRFPISGSNDDAAGETVPAAAVDTPAARPVAASQIETKPVVAAPRAAPVAVPAPEPAPMAAPAEETAESAAATVTLRRTVGVRQKPLLRDPLKSSIPAGTAVTLGVALVNSEGAWRYVETERGTSGWVAEADLAP